MALYLGSKVILAAALMLTAGAGIAQTLPVIYDVNNSAWQADSLSEYIIVLKNNKSCAKCFTQLDKYLYDSLKGKDIYCITLSDSSSFARKNERNTVHALMPHVKNILFSYSRQNSEWMFEESVEDNTIFTELNINVTPAILYVSKNKIRVLPFESLFSEGKIEQLHLAELAKKDDSDARYSSAQTR